MIQRKVAADPAATLVMVVVGEFGFTMVAEPATRVHWPVPVEGILALMKKVPLLHCSISSAPASAVSGRSLLVITTSSVLSTQLPLVTVHRKVKLVPAATAVTVVFERLGLVMFPLPDTIDQVPVPIAGTAAPIVKVPSLHCSWSLPAVAAEGSA